MFNVYNGQATVLTTNDLYHALGFIKYGYQVKANNSKAAELLAGVDASWGVK